MFLIQLLCDSVEADALGTQGKDTPDDRSGFLINIGNATCADVQELIRQVQETVFKKTGYRLEPEVGSFQ